MLKGKLLLAVIWLVIISAGLLVARDKATSTRDNKDVPRLEDITLTLFLPDGDAGYLPHLVAMEKGYFKRAGCNLIIRQGHTQNENDETDIKDVKEPIIDSDLYLMGRARVYRAEAIHPGLIKVFNVNTQDDTIGKR